MTKEEKNVWKEQEKIRKSIIKQHKKKFNTYKRAAHTSMAFYVFGMLAAFFALIGNAGFVGIIVFGGFFFIIGWLIGRYANKKRDEYYQYTLELEAAAAAQAQNNNNTNQFKPTN